MKGLEFLLKGLTVAVLSVAMCSCGGSDDENDDGGNNNNNNNNSSLVGTWRLTSMSADGQTVSAQDLGMSWTMVFSQGGGMTVTLDDGTGPVTGSGTWQASGNTLTLTVEGTPWISGPYTLSGNTLTVTVEGVNLNFTR